MFVRRTVSAVVVGLAVGILPVVADASKARHSASRLVHFRGTVVAPDRHLGAWIITAKNGTPWLVRTTSRLHAGLVVSVSGREFSNHVIRARSVHRIGRTHRFRIRGTLLAHTARSLTIADNGAVVTIRRAASKLRSQSASLPANGTDVTVTVGVDQQGNLAQEGDVQSGNTASDATDVTGTVVSITQPTATGAGSVVLTPDNSTVPMTLIAPAGVDLSSVTPGVVAQFEISTTVDPTTGQSTFTIVEFSGLQNTTSTAGDDDGNNNDGTFNDGSPNDGSPNN